MWMNCSSSENEEPNESPTALHASRLPLLPAERSVGGQTFAECRALAASRNQVLQVACSFVLASACVPADDRTSREQASCGRERELVHGNVDQRRRQRGRLETDNEA